MAGAELSGFYETEPVGFTDQPWFVNAAARLKIDEKALPPRLFLGYLLDIEAKLGRKREKKWGPRAVDLDLLLYGSRVIREEGLVVPHPEMAGRAFVLVPLLSLAPDARLPDGTPLARLLEGIDHQVSGSAIRQPRHRKT